MLIITQQAVGSSVIWEPRSPFYLTVTTTTIAPNEFSTSTSTSTSVDPAIAGGLLYHINPQIAVKGVLIYKNAPYDTTIQGTLIPLLMLNFYP